MTTAISALWASIVRTITPIIVGAVLGWFASAGIAVDEQFEPLLTSALTLGFSGVYYVVVRLLETYVTPKLGWLLGLAKSPDSYSGDAPAKHAA